MSGKVNRQILLKSRPSGMPAGENFELGERPVPEPRDGEILMRTLYLSLDPYMRGRMSDAKSYAKSAELGRPMVGGTVGEVVASRNPEFAVGDIVLGSVVGQIAKIKGCHAVGVAGGAAKCRYVVDELGFDACVDHHAPDLAQHL